MVEVMLFFHLLRCGPSRQRNHWKNPWLLWKMW
jgi:hypothetical protein